MGIRVVPRITMELFQYEEGDYHGAVDIIPFLFALGINTASNQMDNKLRPFSGDLVSGADNTYIIGSSHIAFFCLHRHKERVSLSGISLQLTKTQCYITAEKRPPKYHIIQEHIAEGKDITHANCTNDLRGITVYGIPIGTTAFTSNYLEKETERTKYNIVATCNQMDPTQITAPELPGPSPPPDPIRRHMPMLLNGPPKFGVYRWPRVIHPPMMDLRMEEGISLPGQLCVNHMKEWLGPNSVMNSPAVNPWDALLTQSTASPIMREVLLSWNALQDEVYNLSLDDDLEKDKLRFLQHPLQS